MLFYVVSETQWNEDCTDCKYVAPFEKCYLIQGYRTDERIVDNPNKLKYIDAEKDWYENGENHRVIDGHICRDFEEQFHVIDIDSIEELLELGKKYKTNIGVSSKSWRKYNGIELPTLHYDYYME